MCYVISVSVTLRNVAAMTGQSAAECHDITLEMLRTATAAGTVDAARGDSMAMWISRRMATHDPQLSYRPGIGAWRRQRGTFSSLAGYRAKDGARPARAYA